MRAKKEVIDYEHDVEKLIELGLTLDLPTVFEYYWTKNDGSGELYKPLRRDQWIEQELKIRTKKQGLIPFILNRAQREYSARCTKQNIVLKARQVGITSYVAAKFFLQTITHKGTLTMQVAHDQESAEEIFRIVQPGRMAEAERRVAELEKNEVRRNVYDRIVSAVVAMIISAAIAMHDRWLK